MCLKSVRPVCWGPCRRLLWHLFPEGGRFTSNLLAPQRVPLCMPSSLQPLASKTGAISLMHTCAQARCSSCEFLPLQASRWTHSPYRASDIEAFLELVVCGQWDRGEVR